MVTQFCPPAYWRCCFLVLAWNFFSPAALVAQSEPFSEFALGVRQGYQFSLINFNPGVPQGLNQGISSGLVLQYFSQPQVGFQMEINYSQKGWNAPAFGQPVQYQREIDYLDIPFLTHFAIGKKSFRVVINAGSYLSILLKDKATFFGGEYQDYYDATIDNKAGFGITGGLGLALRTRLGVFQIEGRGALGLTNVFSDKKTPFVSSPEIFFGYQAAYLYRFGIPKKEKLPTNESIPPTEDSIPEQQ